MELGPELVLSSIEERKIYYFCSEQISSEEPHYFVCITRTLEVIIFSCCTTQEDTMNRLIRQRKYLEETIIFINPSDENKLKLPTFVNCNEAVTYPPDEFTQMYKRGDVKFKGELSEGHYEQILHGVHKSTFIAREIKAKIPPPDLHKD